MTDKTRENKILMALIDAYPQAGCELKFDSVFQLLVAVILSAQCTDKRVNEVTKNLFVSAPAPSDFDKMPQEELEKQIYSCGFYRNKAKNIKAAAKDILVRFGGVVPATLKELTSLAGVGRKTANVVLSEAYNLNAIAVDTHVFRCSRRLGLSSGKTPEAVEKDLTQLFSNLDVPQRTIKPLESVLGRIHHALIFHGRYCCKSQRPNCDECPVRVYCIWLKANNKISDK